MNDFWFRLLLGHLVGDYLLQNNWMALQKNKHEGLGLLTCFVHCILYTSTVMLFTWISDPYQRSHWFAFVFASHWFVDRYGWAEKWLQLIKGRSLTWYLQYKDPPFSEAESISTRERHDILRGGFNILVYTAVDNTMHLVLMFLGWKLLYA